MVKEAEEFATSLKEHDVSMAQLQGFFLSHKTTARAAMESLPALVQSCKRKRKQLQAKE